MTGSFINYYQSSSFDMHKKTSNVSISVNIDENIAVRRNVTVIPIVDDNELAGDI